MLDRKRWEMSKKRFEAYWNHEIPDRCLISITALKDGESRFLRSSGMKSILRRLK